MSGVCLSAAVYIVLCEKHHKYQKHFTILKMLVFCRNVHSRSAGKHVISLLAECGAKKVSLHLKLVYSVDKVMMIHSKAQKLNSCQLFFHEFQSWFIISNTTLTNGYSLSVTCRYIVCFSTLITCAVTCV